MSGGMDGLGDRALEAVRQVAEQYTLPSAEMKPCVALLLDGNLGGASRHESAFIIAIECRRMGLDAGQARAILRRWAPNVGCGRADVDRAVRSAFRRKPNGEYQYHPPGLRKPPEGLYARVLGPTCLDVDCPRNCPPFTSRRRADHRDEDFVRFVSLGWLPFLRSRRFLAAGETYRAICWREQQIEWAPGQPFFVTHAQLADLSNGNRRSVARHLRELQNYGLIEYECGSGEKGSRRSSRVARVVPIPGPPSLPAIQNRARRAP